MGKAKRKMRPQPPWWWTLDNDNCWFCKNRNNCGSCKLLKQQRAKERRKNMKIDLQNVYSPCGAWCLSRGVLYSPDNTCCQRCEYNIAIQILKEVLKQNDYCWLCKNAEHIKGGYTECTLGYDGWQECDENYGIDWNAVVEEYGINIGEGNDCNRNKEYNIQTTTSNK